MPVLLPSLVFWEAFVREGGQAETGVADTDILPLIGENFRCDINKRTLPLGDHLPRPFVPMHQNKLVDPVGCVPLFHDPLLEQSFLLEDVAHSFLSSRKNSVG
jgi:hypothetical protein